MRDTPNCNNVVIEKKQKAKKPGINQPCDLHVRILIQYLTII